MLNLYYFDVFARAEPIRMMLSHAKIPFNDIRINGETMKTMKEDGTLEYGQVPMLELEDGTKLSQSTAIINYVATTYGFQPNSPLDVYRGMSIHECVWTDFGATIPPTIFSPPSPARDAKMEEIKPKF